MPSEKHKPEEIIGKLREVEIMLGQGGTTAERTHGCGEMGQGVLQPAESAQSYAEHQTRAVGEVFG